MHDLPATRMHFSIHGRGVELVCSAPTLLHPLQQMLGPFEDRLQRAPSGTPIVGTVGPYRQDQVLRYLSPAATRIACDTQATSELYQEAERFWLIDDHWGLCQINILKAQFRSWIIREPAIDAPEAVEQAVIWPIAQLLRPRGLWLVPSASVVRDGWGALLISTFSIEPELTALVRAGYRIVGQNWTALREHAGRAQMLAMPGYVHRPLGRTPMPPAAWQQAAGHRVDLTAEFCGCGSAAALCDAVILICPGRRPLPHLEPISPANALSALRRAWPIVELHPQRRPGLMPARLAQRCAVFSMQLSRNPRHVLDLLDAARTRQPPRPGVWIHAPNIRRPVVA
ncbi:MAG TPA: hypothetical protein VNL70_00260 [Tepidisphaeraceae bacterium]|nr:hypothetical protein [Tepidisphaeraceae bacterium]